MYAPHGGRLGKAVPLLFPILFSMNLAKLPYDLFEDSKEFSAAYE